MATTDFVDGITQSAASWFDDVDALAYEGVSGFETTVTAAATTTLTIASKRVQEFTGTTTQIITLPVTSTLSTSCYFDFINNSTGALTINSSGGNLILHLGRGERCTLKCILASGTTAASWAIMNWQSGGWITPTFDAAAFTGYLSMTWTVEAGDVQTYAYRMDSPTTMTVDLQLDTSTVGGTPSSLLQVAVPAGKTATKNMTNSIYYKDDATRGTGFVSASQASQVLLISKADNTAWSAATNTTQLYGQITFEVDP